MSESNVFSLLLRHTAAHLVNTSARHETEHFQATASQLRVDGHESMTMYPDMLGMWEKTQMGSLPAAEISCAAREF